MIDTPLTFRPSAWVRDVQTADGVALLDIHQGTCFSLNPVGVRIWNMLKLQSSINEMSASIAAEFDVVEQQVRADVVEFIQRLDERGLAIRNGEKN
ncbi:MAG TPA: PqqD family protein [Pyrinomonadaceae bacterium]|nr:PqqD family protein [Pyrinomonadaceae bacterium]